MSRVLIIEDERETAMPVKEALEIHHVEADIASDGEKGLRMFRERYYDLILLDLKMPEISGEMVLTEIRKEDPFIDIIIYTNYTDFTEIKKLTNIGIQGYINKGAEADLQALVDVILEKLAPLDADAIEKMIKHTPSEMFDFNVCDIPH